MLEPIKVLGAMITPAVMISAAALLVLSTASRLGRVNDRLQRRMKESEVLTTWDASQPVTQAKRQLILEELAGLTERLVLLRSAVIGLYVSIAFFLATGIIVGMSVVFPAISALVPVALGMLARSRFSTATWSSSRKVHLPFACR